MLNYIYDGTFEGFLTVIDILWTIDDQNILISNARNYQPNLFDDPVLITTDSARAGDQMEVLRKYPREVFEDISYCLISEEPGIELTILEYLKRLAGCSPADINRLRENFADNTIKKIRDLARKVSYEITRFHGFVRFRQLLNGVYYATIAPDYNIVQFLAPHFTARFADQNWLIHDLKRHTGIYYETNRNRCVYLSLLEANLNLDSQISNIVYNQQDNLFQELWNVYFHEIAITERINKKLQRQRIPKRYWKNLVERIEE